MKLLLCVVSAILTLAASDTPPPLLIDLSIKPLEDGELSAGIVPGVSSCGGLGTLVEVRVGECSGSGSEICKLTADGLRRLAELEFIPSEDIPALGVRIYILENEYADPRLAFQGSIPDSQVTADEVYVFRASTYVDTTLKDKSLIVQFVLYRDDGDSDVIEICAQAEFKFI